MAWIVWRADLSGGQKTHVVVDDESFEMHPYAQEYAQALYALDRSPNTVKTYLRPVARFLTWCDDQGVDWTGVNLLDLARFKRHVENTLVRGKRLPSDKTVSLTLTAVCEFIRYCSMAGHVAPEVASRLVERKWVGHRDRAGGGLQMRDVRVSALRVRTSTRPPQVVSPKQRETMRQAATTVRDQFLLQLLAESGVRIGEALGLRRSDLHFLPDTTALGCSLTGPHLHVTPRRDNANGMLAKSRRPRAVPVTDELVATYRDYHYERDQRATCEAGDYVFVNYAGPHAGAPMTYSNAYQLVRRLGRGTGAHLTPHMFRHTAATEWVDGGTEVDVVQELLGHASLSSTQVYFHPTRERMRAAVDNVAATARR